jgi:hypothetical protein
MIAASSPTGLVVAAEGNEGGRVKEFNGGIFEKINKKRHTVVRNTNTSKCMCIYMGVGGAELF